tara:strand:- start:231 stop:569 length:339 start_codon:yes stop_codon:yes gene_type:complete
MSENKINEEVDKKTLDGTLNTIDKLEEVLPLAKLDQVDISRLREIIANYRKFKNCGELTRRNYCVINGVPPTMENYNKIRKEMFRFIQACTLRAVGATKAMEEELKFLPKDG